MSKLSPGQQRMFLPASVLVVPLAVLLFAQWPLRDLVQAYSRKLGYRVERVHISSCEEREESATAHVVLIGHSAGHSRRFEDAVTLRRRDGHWGIVLPVNFGRYPR